MAVRQAPKQLVTLRVQPDVWAAMQARADRMGVTRAALVDYVLAQAANPDLPDGVYARERQRWLTRRGRWHARRP